LIQPAPTSARLLVQRLPLASREKWFIAFPRENAMNLSLC